MIDTVVYQTLIINFRYTLYTSLRALVRIARLGEFLEAGTLARGAIAGFGVGGVLATIAVPGTPV
ncbi:MAG TPA: hypothetical protein VHM69_05780 [Rubrobacter sp.]|nr:hypothetical protein [Rubrobacter sp.]